MKRALESDDGFVMSDTMVTHVLPKIKKELTELFNKEIGRANAFIQFLNNPLIPSIINVTPEITRDPIIAMVTSSRATIIQMLIDLRAIKTRLKKQRADLDQDNTELIEEVRRFPFRKAVHHIWPRLFHGDRVPNFFAQIYGKILKRIVEEWEKVSEKKKTVENTPSYLEAFNMLYTLGQEQFPGTDYAFIEAATAEAIKSNKPFYNKVVMKERLLLEMALAAPDVPTEVLGLINNLNFLDIRERICTTCQKPAVTMDAKLKKLFCGIKCQQMFYDRKA